MVRIHPLNFSRCQFIFDYVLNLNFSNANHKATEVNAGDRANKSKKRVWTCEEEGREEETEEQSRTNDRNGEWGACRENENKFDMKFRIKTSIKEFPNNLDVQKSIHQSTYRVSCRLPTNGIQKKKFIYRYVSLKCVSMGCLYR